MKACTLLLVATLLSMPASGSYYLGSRPINVQKFVIPFGEYEKVGLSIQLSGDASTIAEFNVFIDDDVVEIPVEDVVDYKYPNLNSLLILYSSESITDLYVYLEFETLQDTDKQSEVYFNIRDKVYVSHRIEDYSP